MVPVWVDVVIRSVIFRVSDNVEHLPYSKEWTWEEHGSCRIQGVKFRVSGQGA